MTPSPKGAKGAFIAIEGVDGAGKSTQARLLAEHIGRLGRECVLTREPGGSEGAEAIRGLLLEGAVARWSEMEELLLFTAARCNHVAHTIAPALARGAVVISDRFADSTRVYQAALSGSGQEMVDWLHAHCVGLNPDLTLLLDISDGEACARRARRRESREADRFERKMLEDPPGSGAGTSHRFLEAYRALAREPAPRRALIDACGAPEEVAMRIRRVLEAHLLDLGDGGNAA